MARRSPQNPRYRKDAQVGTTRRSAASAKPKREAGASGASSSGGKKGSSAKKGRVLLEPDTPEFKRWRKIWLGLLVAAVVFSVGAWFTRETPVGTVALVFAYATLFTAVFIDITKIRRLRKAWRDGPAGGDAKGGDKRTAEKKADE